MKKAVLYVTIILITLFMYSCSKTPSEKLAGVWDNESKQGMSIHNNGTWSIMGSVFPISGTWTLNDKEPLILKFYDEKGDLFEERNFSFINENTFELSKEDKKNNIPGDNNYPL